MDDFSHAIWVTLPVDREEVPQTVKNFIAMSKRQFNKQVKIVKSDNVIEFTSLKNYFLKHRIIFQISYMGAPQQNGRIEWKH